MMWPCYQCFCCYYDVGPVINVSVAIICGPVISLSVAIICGPVISVSVASMMWALLPMFLLLV